MLVSTTRMGYERRIILYFRCCYLACERFCLGYNIVVYILLTHNMHNVHYEHLNSTIAVVLTWRRSENPKYVPTQAIGYYEIKICFFFFHCGFHCDNQTNTECKCIDSNHYFQTVAKMKNKKLGKLFRNILFESFEMRVVSHRANAQTHK